MALADMALNLVFVFSSVVSDIVINFVIGRLTDSVTHDSTNYHRLGYAEPKVQERYMR